MQLNNPARRKIREEMKKLGFRSRKSYKKWLKKDKAIDRKNKEVVNA